MKLKLVKAIYDLAWREIAGMVVAAMGVGACFLLVSNVGNVRAGGRKGDCAIAEARPP